MEGQTAAKGVTHRLLPAASRLARLLERMSPILERVDRVFSGFFPYVVAIVLGGFFLVIYWMGSSMTINIIMEGFGIVGGLVAVYFIYRSLSQEKSVQLFQGERLILKSDHPKTYVVVSTLGEKDVPYEPISSTLYLTNIGIIAEPKGTGDVAVFIPLDRVTGFSPFQNGMRVRFLDVKHYYVEVLLFVEDRDLWIQTLTEVLNSRVR